MRRAGRRATSNRLILTFACQRDGLAQHVQVADVVGQQQQQAGLQQLALLVAEAAVGGDQRVVSLVAGRVGVAMALAGGVEVWLGRQCGHGGRGFDRLSPNSS